MASRTIPNKPARGNGADESAPAAEEQSAAVPEEPVGEQPADAPAPDGADQAEPPQIVAEERDTDPEQPPPGVYEYVAGIGCVYPHIPLTCRAFHPAVEATETTPEIPEQTATVFEWLDGPPADGRWAPTEKPPTQVADNAGGLLNGKE